MQQVRTVFECSFSSGAVAFQFRADVADLHVG